jgi:hypothetical protein
MKIAVIGGGGVTSCLSLRLHDALQYYAKNKVLPTEIDCSGMFSIYRDYPNEDVSKKIFGNYEPDNNLEYVGYDHGWQFAMYDEIQLDKLSKLATNICPVSSYIGNMSYDMAQRIKGRTAVLYRGNDKALDIPRTHYQAMIQMALDSKSTSFIVQTDENDFFSFFKERFPDTICFNEIPRINKDPDAYVMPTAGHRVEFCLNFVAALRAIAQADKIIMNTGNTGIWTMLFRGHTKNVWQVHGKNQQWRKLI